LESGCCAGVELELDWSPNEIVEERTLITSWAFSTSLLVRLAIAALLLGHIKVYLEDRWPTHLQGKKPLQKKNSNL